MKAKKRKKCFIGAIIGGITGLAGGLISSSNAADAQKDVAEKQAALQKEMFEKQQSAQNRKDTIEQARALTQQYNNQDYVNDYRKKVTLKYGGKNSDRIARLKKFKCGGRKKASWGAEDTSAVINGALSAIGSIGSSYMAADATRYAADQQKNYFVEKQDFDIGSNSEADIKKRTKRPTYENDGTDIVQFANRFKCGGRHKRI